MAFAGHVHQHLAHGAGGDAAEVQWRGVGDLGILSQFEPRLMHQRGGGELARLLAAQDIGRKPPQLLIDQAEPRIEKFSLLNCRHRDTSAEKSEKNVVR